MIQILIQSGKWVEVYSDDTLATDELNQIANDSGLQVGSDITALLPDGTLVDCNQVVAIRFKN